MKIWEGGGSFLPPERMRRWDLIYSHLPCIVCHPSKWISWTLPFKLAAEYFFCFEVEKETILMHHNGTKAFSAIIFFVRNDHACASTVQAGDWKEFVSVGMHTFLSYSLCACLNWVIGDVMGSRSVKPRWPLPHLYSHRATQQDSLLSDEGAARFTNCGMHKRYQKTVSEALNVDFA